MKKSNIVRTLFVVMVICSPSMAAIYSSGSSFDTAGQGLYAFKPTDVIFPGFLETDPARRPEGNGGFSEFVQEIRNAVRSTGGAPLRNRARRRPPDGDDIARPAADTAYDTSIKTQLAPNPSTGNAPEVYLGVSVKKVLEEIPPPNPVAGDRQADRPSGTRPQSNLSSGSIRRGSLGGSGWLGGGFLSAGNSGWTSGFGLDLMPPKYSSDLGNTPYVGGQGTDGEASKGLRDLRRVVIDLVFNPYVYFSLLILSVLMFMARFRGPAA
jgi:hypothetical protein